jgi:tetratricopeptide (TPR) repeat protein
LSFLLLKQLGRFFGPQLFGKAWYIVSFALQRSEFISGKENVKEKLTKILNKNATVSEIFQGIYEFLNFVKPILIVFKNCENLDDLTILYLHFHFSLQKERKETISFMLIYNDYNKLDKIRELKNYCQRYGILQRSEALRIRSIIRDEHFVGRSEEIKRMKEIANSLNNRFKMISIMADAGIGKTSLIRKFIEIYEKENQEFLKLNIYCSLSQSELISIANAIIEETTLFINKNILNNAIGKIMLGKKEIIKEIPILKEFYEIVENMSIIVKGKREFKEKAYSIFEKAKTRSIEEEIRILIDAVLKLLRISRKKFIILIVDDLHWMDEDGAMFIHDLKEVLKKHNKGLLIISSIRKTEYENRKKQLAENEVFVKELFEMVEKEEKIYLKGFNKDLLASLIEVATNIRDRRIKDIASEIIKYLSGDKDEANTLFAVETFNLITDEQFSRRYGTIKIIERGKLNKNLNLETLREIFEKLKKTYESSYLEAKGSFDLPSFAVLEGKMDLLKDELKERGLFTSMLLFTSALGDAPFVGNFIFEKLKALKTLNINNEEIKQFQNELGEVPEFKDIPFEILEEIYEIIKRFRIENLYEYKHSLLKIYFFTKIEQILSKYSNETKLIIYKHLYEDTENYYNSYFENKILDLEAKFYLNWSYEISKRGYKIDKNLWGERYLKSLEDLGGFYYYQNKTKEAIIYFEEGLNEIKEFFEKEPDRWIENYAMLLNNLGLVHYNLNDFQGAIKFYNEALNILKPYFENNPDRWIGNYANLLNNLGLAHSNLNDFQGAIRFYNQALNTLKPYFESNPDRWIGDYVRLLNNLGLVYDKLNNFQEAIRFYNEALNTLKPYFESNPDRWVEFHAKLLNNLGLVHYNLNDFQGAIRFYNEALNTLKPYFENNPDRWIINYVNSLSGLAFTYLQLNNFQLAKKYLIEAKKLLENYPYTRNLPHLSNLYNFIKEQLRNLP